MSSDYDCYRMYLALKMHFKSSTYDYFKYNGVVKVNYNSYQKRKDKRFFEKLARLYHSEDDMRNFFVSNFIYNKNMWIGEAFTDDCVDVYKSWLKKNQSLQYVFKNDCSNIIGFSFPEHDTMLAKEKSFDSILKVKDGQHPPFVKMLLSKKINLETFMIFNEIFGLIRCYDKNIKEDVIWPSISFKCKKYRPFLNFDVNKYKSILKNALEI